MNKTGKKKVLYVSTIDETIKCFLIPHMITLREAGYDVDVACFTETDVKIIEKEGFKVYHVNFDRRFYHWSNFVAFFEILRIFKNNKYDILHTHTPVASFISRLAAKLANVPLIIYTIHGAHFHEYCGKFNYAFYYTLEKMAGAFTNVFITINTDDHKKLTTMFPGKNVFYTKGVGLNLEKFRPDNINSAVMMKLRNELGIVDGEKVIGIVAEMIPRKRHIDFLQAASLISTKQKNVKYLIVGKGKLMDDVKEAAVALNIQKNCIFTGYRNDILWLMSIIDIFVFPSIQEGLPVAVMEAMSMKKPVIATNIRGCRDLILDKKTGILIPVRNPKHIAEAVLHLLKNPKEAAMLGDNARKRIESDFELSTILKQLLSIYRGIT